MFRRLRLWLGPERLQALFFLLALTGIGSLLLNIGADDAADWVPAAQNILVGVFVLGTAIIIGSRMDNFERGRWLGILAPALGAVIIGLAFFPDRLGLVVGLAVGWIVAGIFLFRPRGPMAYQQAIKAFRKNNFEEAIDTISQLIKEEPGVANHYRLRAEFFRVWGKLDRAKRDYKKVADLLPDDAPDAWVGHNGIAEVELQLHNLNNARTAALIAYERAPSQWVTAYNLGMIEDRAHNPQAALEYLDAALAHNVPEAQYRFLIHFYRARAYARLDDAEKAAEATRQMRALGGGLNQWQIILQSEQANTLRQVLAGDIDTAEQLFNGEINVMTLADTTTSLPN